MWVCAQAQHSSPRELSPIGCNRFCFLYQDPPVQENKQDECPLAISCEMRRVLKEV